MIQPFDYRHHLGVRQGVLSEEVVLDPELLDYSILELAIGEKPAMIETRRRDWKLPKIGRDVGTVIARA